MRYILDAYTITWMTAALSLRVVSKGGYSDTVSGRTTCAPCKVEWPSVASSVDIRLHGCCRPQYGGQGLSSILPVVPHPLLLSLQLRIRRGGSAPFPLNLELNSSETPLGLTSSTDWTMTTTQSQCPRVSLQYLVPLTVAQVWRRVRGRRTKSRS